MASRQQIADYMYDPGLYGIIRTAANRHNCTPEALLSMMDEVFNSSLVKYEFDIVRETPDEV
mgnify:CR=1 FL=1